MPPISARQTDKFTMPRLAAGIVAIAGLFMVFLFQRSNVAEWLNVPPGIYQFLVNRTLRFLLNDVFTIGLIYALFSEKKYIVFALWVQLAGVVFLLIPYYILKLNFPAYNGPMISFLHRLILNPTLLMLLIPAFYFQKSQRRTIPAANGSADEKRIEGNS